MIPKVGQLLRWYDGCWHDDDTELEDDVGIVKEVRIEGVNFFADDENGYAVIIDWCKGPHDSYHDSEEYEESVNGGEIVVVE